MLLENYKPILLYPYLVDPIATTSWNFTILFGVREIMLQKGKWKKFAVNVSHFNTDNQRDRQVDRQTDRQTDILDTSTNCAARAHASHTEDHSQ